MLAPIDGGKTLQYVKGFTTAITTTSGSIRRIRNA